MNPNNKDTVAFDKDSLKREIIKDVLLTTKTLLRNVATTTQVRSPVIWYPMTPHIYPVIRMPGPSFSQSNVTRSLKSLYASI